MNDKQKKYNNVGISFGFFEFTEQIVVKGKKSVFSILQINAPNKSLSTELGKNISRCITINENKSLKK